MPMNVSPTRRVFTAGLLSAGVVPNIAHAQDDALNNALRTSLFGSEAQFQDAMKLIAARNNPDMAAGLILSLRFSETRRNQIAPVLEQITGQKLGTDWFEWMLWQEKATDVIPHPSFVDFKRSIFIRIDRNFADFLEPKHINRDDMKIRLEEITWGGVRKDGIPSLDNPKMIPAAEADYMRPGDLVFGATINGDTRAYPLRIMGWHEMFNDVIGGVPVALAYCTLCGSGILFETTVKGRSKPLVFGSSGFLYRSNKLMFDRATNSLWNQFTGKPVVGELTNSGITLAQRPVVITTWESWSASHPRSTVLSLDTGHERDYGSGVVYSSYFNSNDLMFPAAVDQRKHKQKDYVFAVRQFGEARAWPLKAFARRRLINDAIGTTPLLLIGDENTRTVRAYERGNLTFATKGTGLEASDGTKWTVTESGLTSEAGEKLPRVAGHIAYWFAWDNYLGGAATVYEG